jgi:hypothetical protein
MCKPKAPKAPPAAGEIGSTQELKAADVSGLFAARAARARGDTGPATATIDAATALPYVNRRRIGGQTALTPTATTGMASPRAAGSTVLGA